MDESREDSTVEQQEERLPVTQVIRAKGVRKRRKNGINLKHDIKGILILFTMSAFFFSYYETINKYINKSVKNKFIFLLHYITVLFL